MMKQLILLLLVTALQTDSSLTDITTAISNGNTNVLETYLDNMVEIAVMEKEDIYTKNQALGVLKSFFAQYGPRSFNQVHKGASKMKDSLYCIGNLTTEGGTFRVYIYIRLDDNRHFIQEMRFDKE